MNGGSRLRQLRELYGLSQASLADIAGVSQPTIARLERGEEVGEKYREVVCNALGAKPHFLEQAIPLRVTATTAWFRAHSTLRAWERERAHRWGELAYELLSHLRKRVRLPVPPRLAVDDLDIEGSAVRIREVCGIPPAEPIPHLVRALERSGIRILRVPLDGQVHAGFSLFAGDEPLILLFSGVPGDRLRFTLAHELGHLVLHGPLAEDQVQAEREASAFAGAFLLPQEAILDDLRRTPATLSAYLQLKVKWGVSIQSLIMRARGLGHLSDWQQRRLLAELGARGWRTNEPACVPDEVPRQVSKAIRLLYGDPPDLLALTRDTGFPSSVARALVAHIDPRRDEGRGAPVVSLAQRRRRPTSLRGLSADFA